MNLALLDSALGSTLSESLTVNTSGDLMQKINRFMSGLNSSRRLKLDSVAAVDLMGSSGQADTNGSTDYFNFRVKERAREGKREGLKSRDFKGQFEKSLLKRKPNCILALGPFRTATLASMF